MRYLYEVAKRWCKSYVEARTQVSEEIRVATEACLQTAPYSTENASVTTEEDVILFNCEFHNVDVHIKKGCRLYKCSLWGPPDAKRSTIEIGENTIIVDFIANVFSAHIGSNCQLCRLGFHPGMRRQFPAIKIGDRCIITISEFDSDKQVIIGDDAVMAGANHMVDSFKAGKGLLVYPYERLLAGDSSWVTGDTGLRALISRGSSHEFGDNVNQMMALNTNVCRLSDEASVLEASIGYDANNRIMFDTIKIGRRGTLQRLSYSESADPTGSGAPHHITIGEGALLLVNYGFDQRSMLNRRGQVRSVRVNPKSSMLW